LLLELALLETQMGLTQCLAELRLVVEVLEALEIMTQEIQAVQAAAVLETTS
jgi:hypothetical protein